MEGYREYLVIGKREEAPRVVTLSLAPVCGEPSAFTPGQFVNVLSGAEVRSYSLAGSPGGGEIMLTVKAMGKISNSLVSLEQGKRVRISEPCGFFYPADATTPRIFLAAGIGIVPCMSILRASHEKGESAPAFLLYSNRTAQAIVYARELMALGGESLHVEYFVTREETEAFSARARRITAEDLRAALEHHEDAHWFLCGGIPFVRDMRLHLKALSVREESIFTESFF